MLQAVAIMKLLQAMGDLWTQRTQVGGFAVVIHQREKSMCASQLLPLLCIFPWVCASLPILALGEWQQSQLMSLGYFKPATLI